MVTKIFPLWHPARLGGAWADVDRFFNGGTPAAAGGQWPMPVAVWEDADRTFIELELPGVAKEDLEIVAENGTLTIRAERKSPPEDRQYSHNERNYGQFERSFRLPQTVDAGATTADLSNGVLTLTLSKRPEAQPRKIEVQVS